MNYWIRAYNGTQFRVVDFVRDFGFIDWGMRHHFEVGDIVFLYATAPQSRITMMMEVQRVGMDVGETADDSAYFISQEAYERWLQHGGDTKYVRFGLLKELSSPALRVESLREHGLSGAPRSPRRLPFETVAYIMEHLD